MESEGGVVNGMESRGVSSRALGRRIPSPLAVLLIAGMLASCGNSADPQVSAKPREMAPAFSLPMLGAETSISLETQRGKTLIIDFWATWCVPCEFQVPALNAFFEAHRADSDVALFGISIDTEGPEVVAEWTAEKGVRYPILLAGEGLAREFGVAGFPTVVIVRADGTIDSRHVGLIEVAELEEILTALRG